MGSYIESLANLANHLRLFTKLKLINDPLVDLFIRQTIFCQTLERVYSPNILPTKPSRCTVCKKYSLIAGKLS